jgi:hypothetical protein
MNDETKAPTDALETEQSNAEQDHELQSRREFLVGLGKWSRAVIAGAVVGGALLTEKPAQAGWLNRRGGCCRGGGWINGGGGGSWVNRRGGWGGGSWINRR